MKRSSLMVLMLLSSAAQAHPVDEVVQGAYLTLAPGKVQLELDLTPGVQVVGALIKALDPNSDGLVSDAEAKNFARAVLGQSTLTLGGKSAPWTLQSVEVPALATLKLGAEIKIYASSPRADRAGSWTLSYQNRYEPVKSQWSANIFLLPSAGWQYGVTAQQHSNDGRGLSVTYRVARS